MTWPADFQTRCSQYTGMPLDRLHWNQWCWCYHSVVFQLGNTGRPLKPQVHWNAIGTTLAITSTQWYSNGNPVLVCMIGTHWKTAGRQLEDYWKHTGYQQFFLQWHFSVHGGPSSRHTRLPLNYHWLRLRAVAKPGTPMQNILVENFNMTRRSPKASERNT